MLIFTVITGGMVQKVSAHLIQVAIKVVSFWVWSSGRRYTVPMGGVCVSLHSRQRETTLHHIRAGRGIA